MKTMGTACVLALCVVTQAGGVQKPEATAKPLETFEDVNVCTRVPVDEAAKALGGRALEARPINVKGFVAARCVYGIEINGGRRAFVIWLNPATDFEGLRAASDPPITIVNGVGDAAYLAVDKDTKRYWLRAVKRNAVTVQVTGDEPDWVKTLAMLSLSKF
jgi:hypothetical protein